MYCFFIIIIIILAQQPLSGPWLPHCFYIMFLIIKGVNLYSVNFLALSKPGSFLLTCNEIGDNLRVMKLEINFK